MNIKQKLISLFILVMITTNLNAQESLNSAGGEIRIFGIGSNSFTIGQVFFNSYSDANYNLTEGVQHAYIVTTLLSTDEKKLSLIKVFPNPVEDLLNVKIENNQKFEFSLLDVQGKLIQKGNLLNNSIINMKTLPSANYYLQLTDKNKEIKTFKIIKK